MNIKIKNKSFLVKLMSGLLLTTAFFVNHADDTEILFTESEVNSNVLFIMDNSGSMTEEVAGTTLAGTETHSINTISRSGKNTARQNRNGGSFNRNQWSIYISSWWNAGIRFPNVELPQGAEVISAKIRLTTSYVESSTSSAWAWVIGEPMHINIGVEDRADSHYFNNGHKLNNRPLSGVSVDWDVPVYETLNETHYTPEIKTLVQEIVNKGSWSEGNALTFVLKRSAGDGLRYFWSRRHSEDSYRPSLIIDYIAQGGVKTRMQVMQGALKTVLNNAPNNLSVGIMNYGDTTGWRRNYPNGIKFPTKGITQLARPIVEEAITVDGTIRWDLSKIPQPNATVTVGQFLSEIADDWEPKGMTPIVDALYEASLYFRGETVWRGWGKAYEKYAAHPTTYAHPDPNKVEPVEATTDYGNCASTYSKKINWQSNIDDWDDGDTGGKKCPDGGNPAGTAAACVNNKTSCDRTYYWDCDWVSAVYGACDAWDEDNNCTHRPLIRNGYCRAGTNHKVWYDWCRYNVCSYPPIPKPKYISPIVGECQSNNIILMSDGKPEYTSNRYPYARSYIRTYIGGSCDDNPQGFKSGACGTELTHDLAENDIDPNLTGDQLINTYVIGFSSGISDEAEEYLESLVTIEDDPETDKKEGYFSAQNEEELANAFLTTLEEIAKEARSQASPGYSVNVKSGLQHDDSIYVPVFDKSNGATWKGNLKKFKIVDADGHRSIRGKKERDEADGYIDAMTELGAFKDDAWDLWSASNVADGNVVKKGGTANLLTNPDENLADGRKLLTNAVGLTLSPIKLSNNSISKELLFDEDELELNSSQANEYRKKLINYIRGWQNGVYDASAAVGSRGVPRLHMGDMLHSEPVVITYSDSEQYIFAATNEGYLHAFDTETGEEKFAFMPKELLKNIAKQFEGDGVHQYGIDGNISYFVNNADDDPSQISGDEQLMLYFGLRRGGHSYYALDITNIESPVLKWVVNNDMASYSRLGQSWSMAYIANVMHGDRKKPAVIFTGGNDVGQDYGSGETYDKDNVIADITATEGDDIYIVDAIEGGNPWWSLREDIGTTVNHAIPGGVRIIDVNRNGLLDRMYFADTGGNVWRLDLDEKLRSGRSRLKKLADLGDAGTGARKFYNEPDVAKVRANGKVVYTVSVGSGLRPHPLNEVIEDHMFILLDKTPFEPIPANSEDAITMSDLAEVTITRGAGENKSVVKADGFEGNKITDTEKDGWYVTFPDDGEKVLASSITFEGSLIFTTLVPKVESQNDLLGACEVPATQGRIYTMNILTAEASVDQDRSGSKSDNDVFDTIAASSIPGTPQTVFNDLDCSGGDCKHKVDVRIGKKSTEIGNENVADIESIYWTNPE